MQKMKAIFVAVIVIIVAVITIAVVDAKDDGKSVNLDSLAPVEENDCIDDGEEECSIDLRPDENPFDDVLIIDNEWADEKIEEWEKEEEESKKAEEEKAASTTSSTTTVSSSSGSYSPSYLYKMGVITWGGYRWTWYSQRVLSGSGLNIPGRYVDSSGFVCDGDGYICLAHSSSSKGSIIMTPFGRYGKVYDACEATYWYGYPTVDVYVNW